MQYLQSTQSFKIVTEGERLIVQDESGLQYTFQDNSIIFARQERSRGMFWHVGDYTESDLDGATMTFSWFNDTDTTTVWLKDYIGQPTQRSRGFETVVFAFDPSKTYKFPPINPSIEFQEEAWQMSWGYVAAACTFAIIPCFVLIKSCNTNPFAYEDEFETIFDIEPMVRSNSSFIQRIGKEKPRELIFKSDDDIEAEYKTDLMLNDSHSDPQNIDHDSQNPLSEKKVLCICPKSVLNKFKKLSNCLLWPMFKLRDPVCTPMYRCLNKTIFCCSLECLRSKCCCCFYRLKKESIKVNLMRLSILATPIFHIYNQYLKIRYLATTPFTHEWLFWLVFVWTFLPYLFVFLWTCLVVYEYYHHWDGFFEEEFKWYRFIFRSVALFFALITNSTGIYKADKNSGRSRQVECKLVIDVFYGLFQDAPSIVLKMLNNMLIGGNFTTVMILSPLVSTISVTTKLAAPWGAKGKEVKQTLGCCCPFGFICCLIIPMTIILFAFFHNDSFQPDWADNFVAFDFHKFWTDLVHLLKFW